MTVYNMLWILLYNVHKVCSRFDTISFSFFCLDTPSCEVSPRSPATFYERGAAINSNQVMEVTGYLQFCNPETNTSLLLCNSVTSVPQVVSDICIQNGYNTGGMVVNSIVPNPQDYFDRPVFSQGVFQADFQADCSNGCDINITDVGTGCISYNGIDLISCRRRML